MNILLVSATKQEIAPFLQEMKTDIAGKELSSHRYRGHSVDVLITGVGIAQTAYYLGRHLSNKYDLAINAGICGSFNTSIKLGELIQVSEDYFADLGAEDDDKFISISELSLPAAYYVKNEHPFEVADIRKVRGVTVNTTHGNEASIQKFSARIKADVESMEGAAFIWACNQQKIKCVQLRAVSNYVEKRDRSKWKIGEAISSLGEALAGILDAL